MVDEPRTINGGWDKPLEVLWDFELPDLQYQLIRFAPGGSGALRNDLRQPEAVTINEEETEIRITIQPPALSAPYALAQDEGAVVPPYKCPPRIGWFPHPKHSKRMGRSGINFFPGMRSGERSWVMRAVIHGVVRFFTSRRGFIIRGSHYVDRAFGIWWDNLVRGQKKGVPVAWKDDTTEVSWAPGRAGETFGAVRGRLSE